MAREVTIRMTVDSSGAVSGLRTLSTEAKKTGDNLKKTGDAAKEGGNAIKNIAGAVDFAMKAFAALKAFDMVSDFVNQGRAIRATSATFGALTANIGGAAAVLQQLRTATGGVVSDMSLMQANNRFLQMGLADTADKAAELSRVAVILGGSMGKDASGAMEEFALLLANQSIPRLDTFGISAGRVRTRIAELQAETKGLSREQAFLQATMEEAQKSIENLGPAAGVAMDGLSRLETGFENFTDKVKQQAADAVVSIGGILELLTSGQVTLDVVINAIAGEFQNGRNERFANMSEAWANGGMPVDSRNSFAGMHANVLDRSSLNQIGGGVITIEQIRDAAKVGASALDITSGKLDDMVARYETLQGAMAGLDNEHLIIQPPKLIQSADAFDEYTDNIMRQQQAVKVTTEAWGNFGREVNHFSSLGNIALGTLVDMGNTYQSYRDDFAQTQYSMVSGLTPLLSGMGSGIDVNAFFDTNKTFQVPEFLRPEKAQQIADQYAIVEEQWQRMSELNKEGLITDDEMAKMTTFRDNVANINSQAQSAAQAFEKMSLTDLFGTTSGGMLGEIGDMTIKYMQEQGRSAEEIAAAQQQYDAASGRSTTSSVAFENVIVPFLADMKPGEQIQAMENLTASLEEFTARGGNLNDLTAEQMQAMTGYQPGGSQGEFTIQPGETLGEVQARLAGQGYQLAISDLLAATNAPSANMVQPGTYSFGQGAEAMVGFNPIDYVDTLLNPKDKSSEPAQQWTPTFLQQGQMQSVFETEWNGFMASIGMGGMVTGASTPIDMNKNVPTTAGFGMPGGDMGGGEFMTNAQDASTAIAEMGASLVTMNEETMPTFNAAMDLSALSGQLLADQFGAVHNSVRGVNEELTQLGQKDHTIKINFKATGDVQAVMAGAALLGQGGGLDATNAIAQATQNNGGVTPGSDGRAIAP